ncbi:hypothetical protein L9F63_025207, partial [Diploptera punctata]
LEYLNYVRLAFRFVKYRLNNGANKLLKSTDKLTRYKQLWMSDLCEESFKVFICLFINVKPAKKSCCVNYTSKYVIRKSLVIDLLFTSKFGIQVKT